MDEGNVEDIFNEILVIKKNEILSFATTWVDLKGIILSKINQGEKDKYHMISHIYNLKTNQTPHAPIYRKYTGGCQRWGL